MKRPVILYAVCDGGRGRLLIHHPGTGLREKQSLESLHLRDKSKDLGTDKPGRGRETAAKTVRHAYYETDLHQLEKQRFSRTIAKEINTAFTDHEFDQLILVAPPRVIPTIRENLSPSVRDVLVQEIQKDLTKVPLNKLEGFLMPKDKTRTRQPVRPKRSYLSKRAATPGSVLPSSHSRNAPPAAET